MPHKKLGEILIEKRLITRDQLEECLEQQRFTREYLGSILLKKKLISEDALMKTLSEQFGMPYVRLKEFYIDWEVCIRFSSVVTSEKKALPIRQDDSEIIVAISDPLDVIGISKIEEIARPKKLKLVLVTKEELDEFILDCKKRAKGALKGLLDKE